MADTDQDQIFMIPWNYYKIRESQDKDNKNHVWLSEANLKKMLWFWREALKIIFVFYFEIICKLFWRSYKKVLKFKIEVFKENDKDFSIILKLVHISIEKVRWFLIMELQTFFRGIPISFTKFYLILRK